MTIHEALHTALTDAATEMCIPLYWQGEVFTLPMAPHIVAHVVIERAEAASLGTNGLTRTDGVLVAECVIVAGKGDAEAVKMAGLLATYFKRGTSLALTGGELTFTTPALGRNESDGRRLAVPLKIPFYAMTFGG